MTPNADNFIFVDQIFLDDGSEFLLGYDYANNDYRDLVESFSVALEDKCRSQGLAFAVKDQGMSQGQTPLDNTRHLLYLVGDELYKLTANSITLDFNFQGKNR